MVMETELCGDLVETTEVDDERLVQMLADSEIEERIAGRRKLRLALEVAHRHVVDDQLQAAHWSDADVRDVEETIGGEGTPMIASRAVEIVSSALGVGARTAMQLLSDALDLFHRQRKLWWRMDDLEVAPWRARKIAAASHSLSPEASRYVEARILDIADSCGPAKLERIVTEAKVRFDPVEQAEAEDEAKAAWGVRLEDYAGTVWAGTSRMEIIGDTPTLHAFSDLLTKGAHDRLDLSRPVDEQPSLEHRKVAALGSLVCGTSSGVPTKAYVHLDYADLPDKLALGKVERLGPLTVATLKEWLGTSRFTLQPVLRMDRDDCVDEHDPPAWMRELVILRDQECAFPWCHRDARDCDLDHIEAFVEMDDGGPPGQTRPDNLAPLCRRHHRAKTHFGWSYVRNRDGTYTWTSPYGRLFLVDGDRVTRL
jgi:hypothetical protein